MTKINSLLFNVVIILLTLSAQAQRVGIGTTTPRAALDVTSTNNGFLPPRITGLQRDNIFNPAAGLIIFCTDCGGGEMQYFSGSSWRSMNMGPALNPPPAISSLNCDFAVNNGTLNAGTTASGVNSVVSYNNGNGGTYAEQSVESKGVTGLMATLSAGTLASGSGNLTYNITGTPATDGIATFDLSIGGKSCTLNRAVQGTVMDASGNTYATIHIGKQIWMVENLRTTKYSDGSGAIPLVTNSTQWANNFNTNATSPMMCWYNNDQATYTANKFGALYNWYAINPATNGNRNICPTGWHVPTDAEWTTLTTFLGGESVAGGKMKSTGTEYWASPNTGASNRSGWSGLPGGYRAAGGGFDDLGSGGYWWSSTETSTSSAWRYLLSSNSSALISIFPNKSNGYSVRCLMD